MRLLHLCLLPNNGFLGATISFSDGNAWLTGVKDTDGGFGVDRTDWIISGDFLNLLGGLDSNEVYENVLGGTWPHTNSLTRLLQLDQILLL
ncbi:MAG: hypothetical protein IPJ79_19350 [Bacteroidetes bacterium]|nr:hypothetical protein [Bacteroidota bacterium]